MNVNSVIESIKDVLARVVAADSLVEARSWANQGIQKVQEYVNEGEKAIDPWLIKWAKSDWSMPIAVGFGLALLVIGDILQAAHVVLFLLKLVF